MHNVLRFYWFIAGLLLMILAPSVQSQSKTAGKPNILIIVGDDMGYADIGVHGCKDIPTPHIDSIAKNGVRFTNGYVSGPYCSPTRAGILTGRYQTRFGHEFNPGNPQPSNFGLPLTESTIAQRLRELGYATGIVGKWHLGNRPGYRPTERGFHEFFGFLGGAHPYMPGRGAPIFRGTEQVSVSDYLTDEFGREAVAFIESHREKPFLLYLAFNAVHTPLAATDKYMQRFKDIKDEKRQKYAAMMSAMDDAIGTVLAKLRDSGIEEKTLVFFISDNGGPVGVNGSDNTPLRGKKAQTWEGGTRVPWMLQWKGRLPAGKVVDSPVIQLDILPTALAAAGQEIPADWKLDGVNLLPFLEGKKAGEPHGGLYWRFGNQMAARVGDHVLVESVGSKGKELYDLRNDVAQTKNLAADQPERVKQMQSAWNEWNSKNVPPAWRPTGKAKAKSKAEPSTKASNARDDAIKKDRKQIEGTWVCVALEVDGNKASEDDVRKITVANGADGTWTLKNDGKIISQGTSTFDPTKKPKTIDFTPTEGEGKGNRYPGIYELADKTRKLCFAPPGKPRPTGFESKSGSEHVLVTFERTKDQ